MPDDRKALFFFFLTGSVKDREFDIVKIGLNREREELFDRINRRVDQMVEAGMEGGGP